MNTRLKLEKLDKLSQVQLVALRLLNGHYKTLAMVQLKFHKR